MQSLKKALVTWLVATLCGLPQLVAAQQSNAQQQSAPATPQAAAADQTQGITVNPSAGPLQPVEPSTSPATEQQAQPASTTPAAPAATQAQNPPPAPQPEATQPQGTAAAQKGVAVGGAASQPAGAAIAPEKQHQVRSWLIRAGLIAGAGIAFGTVYALSHKTSSTPPGVTSTNAAAAH
jgi:hypothetical protein